MYGGSKVIIKINLDFIKYFVNSSVCSSMKKKTIFKNKKRNMSDYVWKFKYDYQN